MIGDRQIKWSGAVIAVLGFGLARTALLNTTTAPGSGAAFLLNAALPVILGLALTALGVGLAVSTLERIYVRTVLKWCLVGTGGMILTVGVTLLDTAGGLRLATVDTATSRLIVNVLIGGAVGGTLIGLRSASTRRHRREATRRAAQSTVLNRVLRHEVLNAVQVVLGYADRPIEADTDPEASRQVIRSKAARIAETIDGIGFLVRAGTESSARLHPVDLGTVVRQRIESVREAHPEASIELEGTHRGMQVWATEEVGFAVEELVTNGLRHNDAEAPSVRVGMTVRGEEVRVTVTDNGPGLDADQRAILEGRRLPEYDDPGTGFGIPRTRLLLDEYDAKARVDTPVAGDGGTRIEVTFRRARETDGRVDRSRTPGDELRRLGGMAAIAVGAGIAMGGVLGAFTETIPVIGGLYGMREPAVGWLFHLFHSVVFGLLFTAAVEWQPLRRHLDRESRYAAVGAGYGLLLWFLAAGIVMPVWSMAIGTQLTVPFLTVPSLIGHLLWGVLFGAGVGAWETRHDPEPRRPVEATGREIPAER